MACGVGTLILSVGAYRALYDTRAAYYERTAFGDVFASAVRTPASLAARIAEIPGVSAVEPRVVEPVVLDVPGMSEPANGVAISLPENRELVLNRLYIRQGRLPDRAGEVAVSEGFAKAHRFQPGDDFAALLHGRRTILTIVGIVLSPEYVYAIGPGDPMPNNRRFGVLWLPEQILAPLYDLKGAFNSVSVTLMPGAREASVVAAVDDLLKPYGGTGAYIRKDQMSNAFLESEFKQLQGMAAVLPPIFLVVAAFLVNMTLARLITLEREIVGLLKALGYSQAAVGLHYLKFTLLIAVGGTAIGFAIGTWLGRGLTELYAEFYTFPFLLFTQHLDLYLISAATCVASAAVGAARSIFRSFALTPAVAMQPPAPPVYRRLLAKAFDLLGVLSRLTLMAIRHLLRQPLRSLGTTLGVSFGAALLVAGMCFSFDILDYMIDGIYFRTYRQDATLSLAVAQPLTPALAAARALPGVLTAEPAGTLPVRIANGSASRRLVITGSPAAPDLSRTLDRDLRPVSVPESGLAITDYVSTLLRLRVGDLADVDLLDGSGRSLRVPVAEIVQSFLGMGVYMSLDGLSRLAGTDRRAREINLSIDSDRLEDFYAAVKRTPAVAGVALLDASRRSFVETVNRNVLVQSSVYLALSVIIAFGVIYNTARIQLSERAREFATLRILGFHRREVARVAFVELGIMVVLAQPIGWAVGALVSWAAVEAFATEMFRLPLVLSARSFAVASLVVFAAAAIAAVLVRRRIDRLDLVKVLKARD